MFHVKHMQLHVGPCLVTPLRSATPVAAGFALGLVALGFAATGCSDDAVRPSVQSAATRASTTAPTAAAHAPDGRALFATADARSGAAQLTSALLASDARTRADATLALTRLHDGAHTAELRSALRDPSPAVRQAASLGLGALEGEAPAGTEAALLGALATEQDAATRAAMLSDLGRIASDTAAPALRAGLEALPSGEREAACRGLGAVGLRGRSIDAALLRLVATRMAEDAAPSVRLACAYALSRLPVPPAASAETTAAIVADLVRAARDDDGEVRLMTARTLGKYPNAPVELLTVLTSDDDWRVAVQAFRSLARRSTTGNEGRFAAAFRAVVERQLPAVVTPAGITPAGADTHVDGAAPSAPIARLRVPSAHVLLVALEEAASLAAGVNVRPVAEDALRRLHLPEGRGTRIDGLAHCLAAKLVDLAHGWPQRLTQCGLGQVSETERSVLMAEVLQATAGDPAGRAGYLLRLYDRGDARVREAVLTAAAVVDDPLATRLIVRGLRESDLGVVTSALEAIAAQPARVLTATSPTQPNGAPASAGSPAPLSGTPTAASGAPGEAAARVSAEVRAALSAARETLAATDELEGLQAWLAAVTTLRDPALAPGVRALATHANLSVRTKAREALSALGVPRIETAPSAIGNALEAPALPRADAQISALLTVPGGEVELLLLPSEAPTTVARFVALVERGFYDGLRFHRVVPAFVAQGGDPRGDGYGGPGYAQRCEDNRVRYERGTVGMALAGRDTGGSQFFVAQATHPHLDSRYTAFARVVRGMDLVDQLLPNDIMASVRIVHATGIAVDTLSDDSPAAPRR